MRNLGKAALVGDVIGAMVSGVGIASADIWPSSSQISNYRDNLQADGIAWMPDSLPVGIKVCKLLRTGIGGDAVVDTYSAPRGDLPRAFVYNVVNDAHLAMCMNAWWAPGHPSFEQ